MPGIPEIYKPNDKDINEFADKERVARQKLINDNWRYYWGDHTKPLDVQPGGHDYNIIMNMCDMVIDRFVEFVGIPRLSLAGGIDNVVGDDGRTVVEKTPEQEMLEALVKESAIEELIPDTLTSGAMAGHNYWKIVVDTDEMGNADISEDNLPYLVLIDPRYITTFWDMTNPKRTLFYRMEWTIGNTVYRQDTVPGWLLPDDMTFEIADDQWAILEYVQKANGKFEFDRGAVWGYPFAPIIAWKTRRKAHSYYGGHDMGAKNINDGYNFVISNTSKIIKHHGHPKTILFGANADQLQTIAPDELWTIENEDARMQSVEMQSDLQSSMNFASNLRDFFFSKMRVIDVSTIKDRLGQITNFGVKMLYNDMLKNVEDRRGRTAKFALNVAFKRMMYMMGYEIDGIVTEWSDPLPIDRKELVEVIEKEQAIGFTSNQTLAKDLGRDFVKEMEQLREESEIEIDDRVAAVIRLAESGVNG